MRGPLSASRAFVSGASGGVGLAVARMLASGGAAMFLTARSADELAKVAFQISQDFAVPVETAVADITQPVEVEATALECGKIDIAVSCSGYIPPGRLEDVSAERFQRGLLSAVFAPAVMLRELREPLIESDHGLFIVVIDAPEEPCDDDIYAAMSGAALRALVAAGPVPHGFDDPFADEDEIADDGDDEDDRTEGETDPRQEDDDAPLPLLRTVGILSGRGARAEDLARAVLNIALEPQRWENGKTYHYRDILYPE